MRKKFKIFIWIFSVSLVIGFLDGLTGISSQAETPKSSNSPSPTPKQVQTEVDSTTTQVNVVGVSATDPSQNGKPASNGALSPTNASSMGIGIQFHFGGSSKKSEVKSDAEDGDDDQAENKTSK